MSQRVIVTLSDLCELHGGGWMLMRCSNPLCRRTRVFDVIDIRDYFRKRRWPDRWRDLERRFYCVICRSRPIYPQWIGRHVDIAAVIGDGKRACMPPFGIDSRAWALAAPDDREMLIKSRR